MALSKIKTNSLSDDAVTAAKIATGTIVAADLAANSVDSSELVAGSVDTAHIAADNIVASLIADNAIDSEHYTDGSIDLAHMSVNSIDSDQYVDASIDTAHIGNLQITTALIAADAVDGTKLADDAVDSEHYTDGSIDTAHIADNQVTLAKMAGLARGKIIYGDASGDPAALTVGTNGQVLKSNGTDISWGTDSGGAALTGSTNNQVTTVTGADAFQGEANLTFDGSTLAVTGALTASTSGQFATLGVISAKDLGVGLHIKVNDTGGSVHADADAFVIEDTAHSGMTFLTSNSTESRINFGDAAGDRQGAIGYDHSSDVMNFYANQSFHTLSMKQAEVVINEGSVDMDFRVESNGNASMLVVNGGTDRIGIGEDTPVGIFHVKQADSGASANDPDGFQGVFENSANSGITILSGTGNNGHVLFGDSGDNDIGRIVYRHDGNTMAFDCSAVERFRLTSNGDLAFGQTAVMSASVLAGVSLHKLGRCNISYNGTAGHASMTFFNSNGEVGSISHSGTTTSFQTSSDYRLKENETTISDGISRIKQLKPYRFNFKTDSGKTLDGFFAHEVSGIVPEAVTGDKDAMNPEVLYTEENDPGDALPEGKNYGDVKEAISIKPQKIDQSKLVPLLVAAVKELTAKVEALENA